MEALISGILRVTDSCAFLETPDGEQVLLAWPADRTTWTAEQRTITLSNLDGSSMVFQDGDEVFLGGGEPNVGEPAWVSPPAESCPADTRWHVGEFSDR